MRREETEEREEEERKRKEEGGQINEKEEIEGREEEGGRKREEVERRREVGRMKEERDKKEEEIGRRNSLLPRIVWKGLRVRTELSAEKTMETDEILRDLNLSSISKEKEENKYFMKKGGIKKSQGGGRGGGGGVEEGGKEEGIKAGGGGERMIGGNPREESLNLSKNYSKILSFSLSLKKEEGKEGLRRKEEGKVGLQIGEEKKEEGGGNEEGIRREKEEVGRRMGGEKNGKREEEGKRGGKRRDNNENFFRKLDVDDFLRELIDNLIYLQNLKHNTKVIPNVLKSFLSFNEMIGEVLLNKKKDQINPNLSVLTIKMTLDSLIQTFKPSKQEEKREEERGGGAGGRRTKEKTNGSGGKRKRERKRMEEEEEGRGGGGNGEGGREAAGGGVGGGGGGGGRVWEDSKKERARRRDIRDKMRRSLTVLDEEDFEMDEVRMEMIKKMYYFNRNLKEYLERQNEEMCRFKSEKFREEFFVCHMKKDQYLQFMKSKNYEKYKRIKHILEKNENHLLVRNNIYVTSQIEKIENNFGKLPFISPKTRIMCKYVENLLDGHKTELGKG